MRDETGSDEKAKQKMTTRSEARATIRRMTTRTTRSRKPLALQPSRTRDLVDGEVKSIRFSQELLARIEAVRPDDVEFSQVVRKACEFWLDSLPK